MPLHLLGLCRHADIATLPIDWPDEQPASVRRGPEETIVAPCCRAMRWVADGPLAAATVRPPTMGTWCPAAFGPLEHAACLAAVHAHISILPVRYGTVLPDEGAVRQFLRNRRDNLLRDLVRVEGTGEIGLRVDLADTATPSPSRSENGKPLPAISPGEYLALRRQRYAWQDRLERQARLAVENFVQAMHGFYREWRSPSSTVPTIVRLAFLVPRDIWGAFRERLAAAAAEQAFRQHTLLGPWPPYSFV